MERFPMARGSAPREVTGTLSSNLFLLLDEAFMQINRGLKEPSSSCDFSSLTRRFGMVKAPTVPVFIVGICLIGYVTNEARKANLFSVIDDLEREIPTRSNEVPLNLDHRERLVAYDNEQLAKLAHYPWRRDPLCRHFDVKFAQINSLPITALTSFPGSGVTWFRQLVEGVTGIYTSTVYDEEPPILDEGNYGNFVGASCRCTILEKNHEATATEGFRKYFAVYHRMRLSETWKSYGRRGVLLLRNPIAAAVAYRNFLDAGQTGSAPADQFVGPDWDEFVRFAAFAWADHAVRWINRIENGTVVFYENLVHHTEAELRRVVPQFHSAPIDVDRLSCAIRHKDRTDRKRLQRTNFTLTVDQVKMFNASIDKVQTALKSKNWPPLPVEFYNFHS